MRLRWLYSGVLASSVACGPAVDVGEGDGTDSSDTDSSGSSVTDASTTVSTSASTSVGTSVGTTDPSTTGPITMTDVSATVTVTTDPSTMTDPTGAGLPDGEQCSFDEECLSGHCYSINLLGGVCGQCSDDTDCSGGGCTPANPLTTPLTPSTCNDGNYGAACQSDVACQPELACSTVFEVAGVLTASTCGLCSVDTDCEPGQMCAPDIALNALTGVNRCVTSGTLADGQSCAFATSGDQSCASGHCAIADVMGLLQLGVCSACEIDDHCTLEQTCSAPAADLITGALTPGACL